MSQLLPGLKGTAIHLRAGAVAKSISRAARSSGLTPRPVFARAWSANADNIQMREDMIVRHYEGKLVLPPEASLIAAKRRHRVSAAVSPRAASVTDALDEVRAIAVALFQFMLSFILIVIIAARQRITINFLGVFVRCSLVFRRRLQLLLSLSRPATAAVCGHPARLQFQSLL